VEYAICADENGNAVHSSIKENIIPENNSIDSPVAINKFDQPKSKPA
jgi:hypothetical protein